MSDVSSGGSSPGGGRVGVWIGAGLTVVALALVLVLQARTPDGRPFDPSSTSPNGYKALKIMLDGRGVELDVKSAASTASQYQKSDRTDAGVGEIIFVPAPSLATAEERKSFKSAAARGALVVFGSPADAEPYPVLRGTQAPSRRELADTPAMPVLPGQCDVDELSDLGAIDAAFGGDAVPDQHGEGHDSRDEFCYRESPGGLFKESNMGSGRLVEMSSPYLWVNARLQPAKESGGQPLDNAATALRLLSPAPTIGTGSTVTMVDPVPSPGVQQDGTKDPIDLLPVRVKLIVVQLLAAFALYVWWRSWRLGKPRLERMPVHIAGSDFVVAMGHLLRRKGNPNRAAVRLRADARRVLGGRLGLPVTAPVETLAAVVARRSGRDYESVFAALADGPVSDSESLVRLARTLVAIRQEVLDVHAR